VGVVSYNQGYIDDIMLEELVARYHQTADPIAEAAVRHGKQAEQFIRAKTGFTKHV
jgi:hypothetical protein